MIAIVLLFASVAEASCVPWFFGSVPRDSTHYYAAGSGETATIARAAAVKELDTVAGYTVNYEQDDHGRCDGVSYALVRIEKKKADAAVAKDLAIKRRAAALAPKVDELSGKVSGHSAQLDEQGQRINELSSAPAGTIIINVDPSKPVSPPTKGMLSIYEKHLKPMLNASLAKVDEGTASPEDIGTIVASYNTMKDSESLAMFCQLVLTKEPRTFSANPGIKLWAIKQCQKGAR